MGARLMPRAFFIRRFAESVQSYNALLLFPEVFPCCRIAVPRLLTLTPWGVCYIRPELSALGIAPADGLTPVIDADPSWSTWRAATSYHRFRHEALGKSQTTGERPWRASWRPKGARCYPSSPDRASRAVRCLKTACGHTRVVDIE